MQAQSCSVASSQQTAPPGIGCERCMWPSVVEWGGHLTPGVMISTNGTIPDWSRPHVGRAAGLRVSDMSWSTRKTCCQTVCDRARGSRPELHVSRKDCNVPHDASGAGTRACLRKRVGVAGCHSRSEGRGTLTRGRPAIIRTKKSKKSTVEPHLFHPIPVNPATMVPAILLPRH